MRVAIFHDFLDTIGGAERAALSLAKHLDADLIATNLDPRLPERMGLDGVRITDLGPLRPGSPQKHIDARRKFAGCRFPGYDRYVFSGNWAHFAAEGHHPNLWYCYTPTRMFYDQRDAILRRLSFGGRIAARLWTSAYRALDQRTVHHCDRIVAISENVRGRVLRTYGREAEVVYPPVETSRYHFEDVGDSWLSVTRLYPEKRIDLQLEIFRRLPNEKLTIVGGYAKGGKTEEYLASLKPPPNVALLGEIPQDALVDLYARCRGLLTTAVDEDFGLTPVEAMASGKCVLATDEGGYRETVVPGETGFLLPPDAEAFARKIRELDEGSLRSMKDACIERARAFDASMFYEKMRAAIEEGA